jgi:FkbM family methyltransferase
MTRVRLPDSMREVLRDAAFSVGVGYRLRAIKRAFEPRYVTLDRRDNEALRAVMAAVLAPADNCIDVGAHEGLVLGDAVRLAPHGRHIAFEPLPNMHANLVRRFPTVDVRQVALSDQSGHCTFVHVETLPGWSGFREIVYPGEERLRRLTVAVERLDDCLPPGYVPRLIKVDVNGAEREVFAGGLRTLAEHRPVVAFEHGRGAADRYGTRPDDVFTLLAVEAGLRIFDLEGNGPYTRSRFVEAFDHAERVNFIAHGLHR